MRTTSTTANKTAMSAVTSVAVRVLHPLYIISIEISLVMIYSLAVNQTLTPADECQGAETLRLQLKGEVEILVTLATVCRIFRRP
jgi:hypothetical protein